MGRKDYSAISRRLLRPAAALALAVASATAMGGCVSYTTYERDTATLRRALEDERGRVKAQIERLESKDADRTKTLAELTERYGALQKEREKTQILQNRLKSEVDALLADLSQLKLMVTANAKSMKGAAASEMLISIAAMEERLNAIVAAPANGAK